MKYVVLSILFLFCLLPFIPYFRDIDAQLLEIVNLSAAPGIILLLTDTAGVISVALPVILLIIGWQHKEKLRIGIYSAAAFLAALITDTTLKFSLQKPRPFVIYHFIHKLSGGGSPSFPSGHTTDAFVTAGVICLLCRRWQITVVAYAWALLVAYSRLALGVHYPSDVMAGAIVGTTAAFVCHKQILS